MESQTLRARGHWAAESQSFRIEYSAAVLDDIRVAAVIGMCKFPRGGLEVGGVLFGTVDGDVIRIERAHPVPCSYAHGPSYLIEDADEEVFREALRAPPGLTPVGWYHSHTRSGLELSAQDAAFHEKFFPEPSQIALLLRPEPFGTAEASFFGRQEDGTLETSPASVFLLRPAARLRRQPRPEAEAEPAAAPPPAPAIPREVPQPVIRPMPQHVPAPLPPTVAAAPRPGRSYARWAPWAAFTAAVLVGIAIWIGLALWYRPAPEELALRLAEVDGQLDISWNRQAEVVRYGRSGALEIQDGSERIRMPLSIERLRAGSVTYAPRRPVVDVRLEIDGRAVGFDSVRRAEVHMAQRAVERQPDPAPAPAVVPSAAAPAPEMPQAPPPAQIRTDEPEPHRSAARAVRSFNLAALPARDVRRHFPQPPQVQSSVPLTRSEPPPAAAPQAAPPHPAPVQPAPVQAAPIQSATIQTTPPKPAYSGPIGGRIIWVGRLARGAQLAIEGGRASSGVLTGELPGVPVTISAQPAELGAGGLRVYASSPSSSRLREPAGPQNGWNATTYDWNPRRLNDVLVTEVPSQRNGWKGLAVRGNGSAVSVIVIDWRVALN